MAYEQKILVVVTSHSKDEKTGHVIGCALEEVTHFCQPLVNAGFFIYFTSPLGTAPGLASYGG